MKKLLITQTSLGGFVRPQAEAEVLGLRGRKGECGRLGFCGPGAPCCMEQALTPADRGQPQGKSHKPVVQGCSWLPEVHPLKSGERPL